MSYKEYNYFKEENDFKENKPYEVLKPNINDKEVSTPKDEVYKSLEFDTVKQIPKKTNSNNKGFVKKIIEKITHSTSTVLSSIAATATVVVASALLFSNVILDKPNIELVELIENYDSVEYNIIASDFDESTNYYVIIHNSFESYQFDLELGENTNTVYNLTSNTLYHLSVIGFNAENQTEVKYLSHKFFTKGEIENKYNASINYIDGPDSIVYFDKDDCNSILFNLNFNNYGDESYLYRMILTDEFNTEYIYEGVEKNPIIDVSKESTILNIKYELLSKGSNGYIIHDTIVMSNPIIINTPTITFDETLVLTGVNEYEIQYKIDSLYQDLEQYNLLTFNVTYNDNTKEEIKIDNFKINEINYLTIKVPSYVSNFTIEYNLEFFSNNSPNERELIGFISYQLENEFKLVRQIVSNVYSKDVKLVFDYHFIDPDVTITLIDPLTNNFSIMDENNNYISLTVDDTTTTNEFKYYLSNKEGEKIFEEQTIVIDCSNITADYNFNYINPGDAIVTYNDDGTINIYLDTLFETTDQDVYYSVVFNNFETGESKEIFYTQSGAAYENIQANSYGIVYNVYKKINNTEYLLSEIAVSGGIENYNDLTLDGTITLLTDNTYEISYTFEEYLFDFDPNSLTLTIDGVEQNIDSSNLTYSDADGTYTFKYNVASKPLNVEATLLGSVYDLNYDNLSSNLNIIGNKYTTIKIIF